jgi:hypothetical protein
MRARYRSPARAVACARREEVYGPAAVVAVCGSVMGVWVVGVGFVGGDVDCTAVVGVSAGAVVGSDATVFDDCPSVVGDEFELL